MCPRMRCARIARAGFNPNQEKVSLYYNTKLNCCVLSIAYEYVSAKSLILKEKKSVAMSGNIPHIWNIERRQATD
jgi:hypothetical protein